MGVVFVPAPSVIPVVGAAGRQAEISTARLNSPPRYDRPVQSEIIMGTFSHRIWTKPEQTRTRFPLIPRWIAGAQALTFPHHSSASAIIFGSIAVSFRYVPNGPDSGAAGLQGAG